MHKSLFEKSDDCPNRKTVSIYTFTIDRSNKILGLFKPPKNEGRYVSLMNANSRYLLQSIPWLDIT